MIERKGKKKTVLALRMEIKKERLNEAKGKDKKKSGKKIRKIKRGRQRKSKWEKIKRVGGKSK